MDADAKFLKRRVKAGHLDVHPTEKALVVNYELEATILGEHGEPMLGERKECQKVIRLKSLDRNTDITALSKEVIAKCKLIHPNKIPEVEQLLYYLQNRKEKNVASASSIGDEDGSRVGSAASHHRYSPIDGLESSQFEGEPAANINNLEEYVELLYEDGIPKVKGSHMILQLARNPDNLEELSRNEVLIGAISRVLREEWRKSIDLTTNIIYVFFCFSTFSQFHAMIARNKIGSLVMDIVEYETSRYGKFTEDLARKKKKNATKIEKDDLEKTVKKFENFVAKQEKTLRVSFYLLLNLSEDIKTEEKMRKRGIVHLLAATLERNNNPELLILVVSFLKKLSIYRENKNDMKLLNIVDKLTPLMSTSVNPDLVNATVRLLLNLSFDADLRQKMVRAGMLPKLVALLTDSRNQNPASCVLYHLSVEDKVKSMFTYTDCIPSVMRLILETPEERVDLEIMALAVNLAANKRNAQLVCEGHGLRVLMQRAFHYQDALVMKMIRNISQHEGLTKNLFVEFIGDVADAVQRADSDEFRVECLGILGNLNIPDLDFERMLTEYDLIPWMKRRIIKSAANSASSLNGSLTSSAENGGGGAAKLAASFPVDDDLILEIVVFLGTCCSDPTAAVFICKQDIVYLLIELLKAKQEDDEIVLQVVYLFHLLTSHKETRDYVIKKTEAVAYLIDLMHDKNPEVQRVCDATLDIISQIDDDWAERVKREKFRFHNAQWLEIIRGQEGRGAGGSEGDQLLLSDLDIPYYREDDEDDDGDANGLGNNNRTMAGRFGSDEFERLVRDADALDEFEDEFEGDYYYEDEDQLHDDEDILINAMGDMDISNQDGPDNGSGDGGAGKRIRPVSAKIH